MLSPYKKQIQQRFDANQQLVTQITRKLRAQQLPDTLVLVPMLESSFNPNAVSPAKAAGLWQLIQATAERFGLSVNQEHDQRFDVQASTDAALAYLRFLYKKFDGDLPLVLAAYNAGEGRVSRAIERANSADYSALKLPAETVKYVSRFYALLEIVNLDDIHSNRQFALFANGAEITTSPLVNFSTLPPLIGL